MKHDEYVKRLEEILLGMEWCHAVKTAHLKEAITAIQQLNNEAIDSGTSFAEVTKKPTEQLNRFGSYVKGQNELRQELRAVIGASMSELDEQIDEILDTVLWVGERWGASNVEGSNVPLLDEPPIQHTKQAKQAIKALIANQIKEAKIDELEYVVSALTRVDSYERKTIKKYIAELKGGDK